MDTNGNGSPRSNVAGQFQTLDLEGTVAREASLTDAGHPRKRSAQMRGHEEPKMATPVSSHSKAQVIFKSEGHYQAHASTVDSGVTTKPRHIAPPSASTFQFETPLSASMIIDTPRTRSRSPPLDGDPEDNPMFWHDVEITGHDPTDPNDDGYGINGLGFKPTAAIAWARSQKRKQQLAEYKNREAREARQRRSERRRTDGGDSCTEGSQENKKNKAVTVRFEDG